ncbi:MAG: Oligopeptide transport ATP-binding protein OppF [Chloroflexi bacterium ADurb.Bin325]|nr:MAG: Oligopeptide transport ATP-binding protein OppF [Chloroflexi bacterium ADurb.Bin325]
MSANLIERDPNVLLEVKNLKMYFPIRRGMRQKLVGVVRAVDNVNLFVRQGETLGLVGESGCGKTTTGRCILRAYNPTAGEMLYRQGDGRIIDLAQLNDAQLKPLRREIRMIFQDPYSSLNPRMTLLEIVGDPLKLNTKMSGKEIEERVGFLLRRVGLRPEYAHRYPHAFSGGERQRIGIARSLALNPRLVVADESVSALDVSVRAQILNLLQDLQQEFGLTYIFVAHDLSVVEYLCDRVAVMYVGKLVELASTEALYMTPRHPYTEALMSAVPKPNPQQRSRGKRIILEGDVADPANPPRGCYFHPRCRYARERCSIEEPPLRDLGGDHFVACHFAEELHLRGAVARG